MTLVALAAGVYVALCLGIIAFQIALILGAPWGDITQGGAQRGPLNRRGRLIAFVSIFIVAFQALAMAKAGALAHLEMARQWGWLALAISVLTAVLNTITPSRKERLIWAPLTLLMCVAGAFVMFSGI